MALLRRVACMSTEAIHTALLGIARGGDDSIPGSEVQWNRYGNLPISVPLIPNTRIGRAEGPWSGDIRGRWPTNED
jgi:hypothetical protein